MGRRASNLSQRPPSHSMLQYHVLFSLYDPLQRLQASLSSLRKGGGLKRFSLFSFGPLLRTYLPHSSFSRLLFTILYRAIEVLSLVSRWGGGKFDPSSASVLSNHAVSCCPYIHIFKPILSLLIALATIGFYDVSIISHTSTFGPSLKYRSFSFRTFTSTHSLRDTPRAVSVTSEKVATLEVTTLVFARAVYLA